MSGSTSATRLPSFLLIGAMKAGTSSLAAYLGSHPEVGISVPKEPNFFSDPGNWNRGVDWYKSLFPQARPILGEASTFYTKLPEYQRAAPRIRRLIPEARLLYLVRDPIERMKSMFIHRADKHQEPARSLAEAIESNSAYMDISRYGMQLDPYLDLFDLNQILVLTTDELHADVDALLSRALRHIGANTDLSVSTSLRLNRGDQKRYLGNLGFALAKAIHRSGVREFLPHNVRRIAKQTLTSNITDEMIDISGATEKRLRQMLAPDMAVIRQLVAASGANVPTWL